MKSKIGDYHNGLRKAKERYCSLPEFLPDKLRDWYEDRAWWVCKVHDNNVGKNGKISLMKAHWLFFKGLIFDSNFGKIAKLPIAVVSFIAVIIKGR